MQQKTGILILALFLITMGQASASTATFTHDYGNGQYTPTQGFGPGGDDYWVLDDKNKPRFSDFFDLSKFTSLESINVDVKHKDNRGTLLGENWKMEADNHGYQVGWLSSSKNGWKTDSFSINASYFDTILKNGGIGFHFSEETWFNDKMKLDSISMTVTGETASTPVPSALYLLGSGIIGLACIKRRIGR